MTKVEGGNAEICKSDLVSSDKLLAVMIESTFKQVTHLLVSANPVVVAFFGSFWGESIAGNHTENRVILAVVEEGVNLPHSVWVCGVITKFDCKSACCCLGLVHCDAINGHLWKRTEWESAGPLESGPVSLLDSFVCPCGFAVFAHHSQEFCTSVEIEVSDINASGFCVDHNRKERLLYKIQR